MSNGDTIPNDFIEAIASSTAMAVGEQPAILANLALANQIANTNLAQQNAISNQQAMFHLELTIVSKCVEMIANINPTSGGAAQQIEAFQKIMEMFAQMSQPKSGGVQAQTAPAAQPPTNPPPPPPGTGNKVAGTKNTSAAAGGLKKSPRTRKKPSPAR